jgi:hypothetical protein
VIPPPKRTRTSRAWTSLLVLVPALASASIPAQPETRVRGFDLAAQVLVGLEGDLSRTSHQGYGLWYGGHASGSLVAPKSGAGTRAAIPEGAGAYRDVGGHHVHAKAGFRGHATYNQKQGFSVSQEFMESRNWSHQDMTSTQQRLFRELGESGRPNTLAEHTRIGVESLKAGGATEAEARALVSQSLRDLRSQGARAPTRIPWFDKDK